MVETRLKDPRGSCRPGHSVSFSSPPPFSRRTSQLTLQGTTPGRDLSVIFPKGQWAWECPWFIFEGAMQGTCSSVHWWVLQQEKQGKILSKVNTILFLISLSVTQWICACSLDTSPLGSLLHVRVILGMYKCPWFNLFLNMCPKSMMHIPNS